MASARNGSRILVVVAGGGYSNAAPLLEIASILASRGYSIEFATLEGRESWLSNWPCISRMHAVGPTIPADVEEANYLRMSAWTAALGRNWGPVFESRKFLESSWPHVYRGLKQLVEDADTRPEFMLADYLVDAARDVSFEFGIPLAMHWPQMPTAMLPASHIPGTPGLQVEVLTSEFATLWQRMRNTVAIYTSLPYYLSYLSWQRKMRASMGVRRSLKALRKPDYLCLVNCFFALEAAKDLPPNVAAIGPILADEFSSLNDETESFLNNRSKVLYISLGTHVLLPHDTLARLISGAMAAVENGFIDGIIWSIRSMARKQIDPAQDVTWYTHDTSKNSKASMASVLNNEIPWMLVSEFVPQRALLADDRIIAFVSHCGASSTNEATFAGTPIIALPVYFDQIQYSMRLHDAGVAIPLRKDSFEARHVTEAVERIAADREEQGPISINMQRVGSIARVAARRKHVGADLIEEVLADWEGRQRERERCSDATRARGMHLQPADMRMPIWKARNWDLYGLGVVACLVAAAPVATILWLAIDIWTK